MKKHILSLVAKPATRTLLALSLFAASPALAQGPGSGGPPVFEETPVEDKETPPPTGVPIDGGASLLLAAGAAYGAKKLRDRKKRGRAGK